ncbi:MAG TPA: sulfatase-like hydrolase/transferase, partial [Burkholderiales bacterium]
AQLLGARGYATAIYGKWHLGDQAGRYPNDRGFDEWYGIPRTTNESMFSSSVGFDPAVVALPQVMQGQAGKLVREVGPYDLSMRRRIDAELTQRANGFMRRQVDAKRPFFAYVPLTQLHFPTLPHPDFAGRTGAGDFADSMGEMDHRVGQMLDEIEALGVAGDTVVLFGSDNGPEFRRPWRGTAGFWTGTYHTAMEGSLRVPFMLRWPGKVKSGKVTNEIVHVADLFPTLARIAGAPVPNDRPIDGIDQLDFLLGHRERSSRDGFVFYIKNELRAVKWRDWKMHFIWEIEPNAGPKKLETPYVFNLLRDPKEETNVATEESWVQGPMLQMLRAFQESLKVCPPIPPGAPDGHRPRELQ